MVKGSVNNIFFISAGPGHRKYLTCEGRAALRASGLVFALNVYVSTFGPLLRRKKVIDPEGLDFGQVAAMTSEHLNYHSVAFLVPGDHSVFSPFQAFIEHFGDRAVMIAGVGLLNAASAALGKSLDGVDAANTVILASSRTKEWLLSPPFLDRLGPDVTLVLYMNHVPLDELASILSSQMGSECPVAVLYNLSLRGGMTVTGTLGTIADKAGTATPPGAGKVMATVIAGRALTATADRSAWDFINRLARREQH